MGLIFQLSHAILPGTIKDLKALKGTCLNDSVKHSEWRIGESVKLTPFKRHPGAGQETDSGLRPLQR